MSNIIPEIRVYSPSEKGDDSNESDFETAKKHFSRRGSTKLTLVRTQGGFQAKLSTKSFARSSSRSQDGASSESSILQAEECRDSPHSKHDSEESKPEFTQNLTRWDNTFHMRPFNLSNFTNTPYRSTNRSQTNAINRARSGYISSSAKSLDILRQNLQKSMNRDINDVIQRYISKFFQPGINNIIANNGKNSVSEHHVHTVCRQILEEAKKMYHITCNTGASTSAALANNFLTQKVNSPAEQSSDVENTSDGRLRRYGYGKGPGRKRRESDTDSEASLIVPKVKRKKGRPPIHHPGSASGRSTPSKIKIDASRREGPKWDPSRLTTDTFFIMGAKANKALGLGATRGRLYIKHPDVFKYSGDQDDKQWLYEQNLMPATGGKAYMLLVEDIKELAETEEYQNNPFLAVNEIVGFTVSDSIISKMKSAMLAMRTDTPESSKKQSKNALQVSMADTLSDRGSSVFTDTKSAEDTGQEESRTVSPIDLELLNTDMQRTDPLRYISETCFDDVSPAPPEVSPAGSDISAINETPLSAPFDITCPSDNTII